MPGNGCRQPFGFTKKQERWLDHLVESAWANPRSPLLGSVLEMVDDDLAHADVHLVVDLLCLTAGMARPGADNMSGGWW